MNGLDKHIENLKGLRKVFCLDCNMRKAGVSCCQDFEPRLCDYILSLKYTIELLEGLQKEFKI